MSISKFEYQEMLARTTRNALRTPAEAQADAAKWAPVEREEQLHKDIMDWCDRQSPWPWQYIRARMDRKSTIGNGIHDLTIFGHYPLCICVECKARDEKQKPDQLIWAAGMERIGWKVHVVRSIEEFLSIVAVQ